MPKTTYTFPLLLAITTLLAACTASAPSATNVPTQSAYELTKMFAFTADAETQTSEVPANDATLSAVVATKSAAATAMAARITAQPTVPPAPTIPANSPMCAAQNLKAVPYSGVPATGGEFLFGAVLTNISATPCFLQAWPQIQLMDRQNQPLDVEYHYFDSSGGDAAFAATRQAQESDSAMLGLSPDRSVELHLAWRNWCGTPLPDGAVIRLTLFDSAGAIDIATNIQASCDTPGVRSQVGIDKLSPVTPPQ